MVRFPWCGRTVTVRILIRPTIVTWSMREGSNGESTDPLEDIAYLARSQNRVMMLEVLSSESLTRGHLIDRTSIASTTVGRILNELSDRGWVERTNVGTYTATPVGRQVIEEFMPLVDTISVIQSLGETVAWFQAADEPLELQHLLDATVRRPVRTDPMAPMNAYMDDLRTANEFYCLVGVAPPENFEKAMRDGTVERGMRVEHVITESEFTYLLDYPDRLERWRDYIEAGANVYCHAGSVPCNFMIFDETVYIGNAQSEYGEPYTIIESTNSSVLNWAHRIIDDYREESRKLTPTDFTKASVE